MRALIVMTAVLAAACAAPDPDPAVLPAVAPAEDPGFAPTYNGIETRLLDGDLVNFTVTMTGARGPDDVSRYAECAAAQYTLIRGYGFARHLRTSVEERGGLWSADAVYTISPSLPRGLRTIDAEVAMAQCVERGIPTV